eukprot:9114216-Pyramimonas_sp.AAC.1
MRQARLVGLLRALDVRLAEEGAAPRSSLLDLKDEEEEVEEEKKHRGGGGPAQARRKRRRGR